MHFQLLFQLDQNTNKYYTSNIYIYFCCSEIITKKQDMKENNIRPECATDRESWFIMIQNVNPTT